MIMYNSLCFVCPKYQSWKSLLTNRFLSKHTYWAHFIKSNFTLVGLLQNVKMKDEFRCENAKFYSASHIVQRTHNVYNNNNGLYSKSVKKTWLKCRNVTLNYR